MGHHQRGQAQAHDQFAQEGARFGITVNAIAPGYIDTDMVAAVPGEVLEKIVAKIPVGRLGQAQEIARGVAFLTALLVVRSLVAFVGRYGFAPFAYWRIFVGAIGLWGLLLFK